MNRRCKFIPIFSSLYSLAGCITIIFIFSITNKGYSQTNITTPLDSLKGKDSLVVSTDSLKADTLTTADSVKRTGLEEKLGIKISKDALPSVVTATAKDSAVLDMEKNLFYLYGKAQVNYEDLKLNAGQVTYNQGSNVVTAAPYEAQKDTGKQTFSQGNEKFVYDSLQYNFKSKRAIVRNVQSQYGEGYMHSEQVKRNPDQSIYGARAIYTTCALDTPHFGIRASKIKVIPGKIIVSGPANLCIEGVPTPLFLPFGLFPVTDKQKSGFVLPTYTIEQNRGLGLLNGGYYFYISDNVDLLLQTNFFTKGSYAVSGVSNYDKIYHYRGMFSLSSAYNKTGEDYEPGGGVKKDFMINWRHQTDAKSKPGRTFNASVQAGTSSFYSNNSYDPNQILQNQYQSNISYGKTWQGKPFGLTVSALHSQNTVTKQTTITLPDVNFYVSQVNPFQSKTAIGDHWYDKITSSYTFSSLNRTTFYDSTFNLSRISLGDFTTGARHSVPVNATYTLFRYIYASFNVNYNEYWVTNQLYRSYNDVTRKIDSVNRYGFFATRDFSTGVNFSTRIYGMKMFRRGGLRGIRHVLEPSTGISYHPDFAARPFNYYYRTRLDSTATVLYQSPYAPIYGVAPLGKAGMINFGLNNNLQIKVRSSKDTVSGFKNVRLIDGLSFRTAYNAAADSFKWSPILADFRTNIMDIVNVTAGANFNPYRYDYEARRVLPQTLFSSGGRIVRFTSANVSLSTNFHSKPKDDSKSAHSEEYTRIMNCAGYYDYVDFNIPWSFNCSYSLTISKTPSAFTRTDTLIFDQTVSFYGDLLVTPNWKLSVNSGYNFTEHKLYLTRIDVYRDLHCWAMNLSTIPFGPNKNFNFTLNVKASVLHDLKIVRRRDFRDAPSF
jgi:lipopolysaccharide assembly outer membrane protein LptD (OstA)